MCRRQKHTTNKQTQSRGSGKIIHAQLLHEKKYKPLWGRVRRHNNRLWWAGGCLSSRAFLPLNQILSLSKFELPEKIELALVACGSDFIEAAQKWAQINSPIHSNQTILSSPSTDNFKPSSKQPSNQSVSLLLVEAFVYGWIRFLFKNQFCFTGCSVRQKEIVLQKSNFERVYNFFVLFSTPKKVLKMSDVNPKPSEEKYDHRSPLSGKRVIVTGAR